MELRRWIDSGAVFAEDFGRENNNFTYINVDTEIVNSPYGFARYSPPTKINKSVVLGSSWTIAAQVKIIDYGSDLSGPQLFCNEDNTFWLRFFGTNRNRFGGNLGLYSFSTLSNPLPLNEWFDFVITFQTNTTKLYIKGELVDTKIWSGVDTNIHIIDYIASKTGTGDYPDYLKDFIVEKRVWDSVEVYNFHKNSTFDYSKSMAHRWKFDNVTEIKDTGIYEGIEIPYIGGYFNGSTSYALCNIGFLGYTNATIEFDIITTDTEGRVINYIGSNNVYAVYFKSGDTGINWSLNMGTPSIEIDGISYGATGSGGITVGGIYSILSDGLSHHIKVTNLDLNLYCDNANELVFMRNLSVIYTSGYLYNIAIDINGDGNNEHFYLGDATNKYVDQIGSSELVTTDVSYSEKEYSTGTCAQTELALVETAFGTGIDFTGNSGTTNSFIRFSHTPSLESENFSFITSITLQKYEPFDVFFTIHGYVNISSAYSGLSLRLDNLFRFQILYASGSSIARVLTTSFIPELNQPYQFAVVKNGTDCKLYINSELEYQGTLFSTPLYTDANSETILGAGGNLPSVIANKTDCILGNSYFFTTPLTQTQIADIMKKIARGDI